MVRFERALFFSWYCGIRDCKYCYMSTQNTSRKAVRSKESLIAELIICKKLGWDVGFISGGVSAFSNLKFKDLLKDMYKVSKEKFWLNIGALTKEELEEYLPYVKGVVGSIESVNSKVHDFVCPSKPAEPYYRMFEYAEELGLKRGMTIILGLGESLKDYGELKRVIKKYGISKIHFYGLNPQKGTVFEDCKAPMTVYQAEWIRKTRKDFPLMDIQCGIWEDRVNRIGELLKAGANSISKFPALKSFGSKQAKDIEEQTRKAGFEFEGTLTKIPDIDWGKEVDSLDLEEDLKKKVKIKLRIYLKMMKKN